MRNPGFRPVREILMPLTYKLVAVSTLNIATPTIMADEDLQPAAGRRRRESALHVGARKKPCVTRSGVSLLSTDIVYAVAHPIRLFTMGAILVGQCMRWLMRRCF